MAQGWSSLPADLVNRVADCLLATNDLDCYTAMRAVCHNWRSTTADPRSNQQDDPRFRPSRWVMVDEHKLSSSSATTVVDGALLFVNTATGRFLRKSLPPFLRDYFFVTSSTDGLLVLAGRDPPHAVSVLNPFTGSLLRFAAPLPGYPSRLTAYVVGSSPPTLVLVYVTSNAVYWAEPQNESFAVDKRHGDGDCPASRLPQIAAAVAAAAGKCAAAVHRRESVSGAKNIFNQLRSFYGCRCYTVVAAGGDMLAVLKRRIGIDVFKIDAAGNVMERVKSIGSQALFLGVRCLVVDTDCFPTVEANCAYFQACQRYIYKFNIGTNDNGKEKPEMVSPAVANLRPLTLTQLLCNYTMDIPCHPLTWERCFSYLRLDCYEDYIDYVDDESDEDYGHQPYYWSDFDPTFEEYL